MTDTADTIEQKCLAKGVKLTEQRKIIAKIISESKSEYGESDHPDVDEPVSYTHLTLPTKA